MNTYTELLKPGTSSGEGLIERCTNKKDAVKSANKYEAHIHKDENPNGSGWDYIVCDDERC